MRKRWAAIVAVVACLLLWAAPALGEVKLVVRGWSEKDADTFAILAAAYKEVAADVSVSYEVVSDSAYDQSLVGSLSAGTGADLFYVRANDPGLALWNEGLLMDCKDMPEIEENYALGCRLPWSSTEGNLFAVPVYGSLSVVYYNVDIFHAQGLNPPATWDEFMAACEELAGAGVVPLANAAGDAGEVFDGACLAMMPNYVGNAEARTRFRTGELRMSNAMIVDALTDLAQLGEYLYRGEAGGSGASRFLAGECAMYIGTSAEMPQWAGADFEWDAFLMPARATEDTAVCAHPEVGIAVNLRGAHAKQAADFLAWLAGPDGADVAANALETGRFPLIQAPMELEDQHAHAILELIDGCEMDAPFVRPGVAMYDVMRTEVMKVVAGEASPEAAANSMAAAFVPWA